MHVNKNYFQIYYHATLIRSNMPDTMDEDFVTGVLHHTMYFDFTYLGALIISFPWFSS